MAKKEVKARKKPTLKQQLVQVKEEAQAVIDGYINEIEKLEQTVSRQGNRIMKLLSQQDEAEKRLKALNPWQLVLVYFGKLDIFAKEEK